MAEDDGEEKVETKTEDDKGFIPNPKELDGAPDLSMLIYLEMRHVLHNLEFRYCKMSSKNVYTSISTILVAINPYERLAQYGQDVIDEIHNEAKKGRLPQNRPHPYGVSARSYMRMVQRKLNQSVIVCGESGAGKTETTKLLMRYLAMTAPSASMESSIVEQQIIAASPILEAYGNAKTVMNNNSSRFGKFTKLLYDLPEKSKEAKILGSYLETYLLEKSRVVFQALNERNYHIFYFMHAGLPKEKHAELHLTKADDFWYTNQGNSVEVAGVSDKDRFVELAESLKLMRIDEALQEDLWRATAGILNLGNIQFKKEGDGFAAVDAKAEKFMNYSAELWGIDAAALKGRLTTANMKVMNKNIQKKINFDDASTNRDSIAKGLYEKVFLWLCARINAELFQMDSGDDDKDDDKDDKPVGENILFIGILDVFGFENFYINSLEQFCINFTNEKLQQFFNYHIIMSEQEEYIKESVFWKPLSIPDNMECIEMIENAKNGFFTLLDSACAAPKPDPIAFIQELFKNHDKNKTIHKATQPGSGNARGAPKVKAGKKGPRDKFDGFMIDHFADHVTYDASNFLVKNMEAVHPDTAKMLSASKTAMIQQLAEEKGKAKKKLTVTGTFHKGIKTLMKNLKETEPFFVRCVNPNMVKSAKIWDEKVVEHQLRCGGLVEALKVLKLGYPTRVPYSTLYDSYHHTVTNPLIKNMGPEAFSTALLIAFDVAEEDYELGLTKIFFKPSKAAVLDTIMAQAGRPLTSEQSEKITKWVVQKRLKQMIGICKSFLELRKRVRLARASQRWKYIGRVTSFVAFSVVRHLKKARQIILERKRNAAAKQIQSFFRGTYETSRYRNFITKVKKATKSIWISYRRWNERILLKQWLEVKVAETRKRKEEEHRKMMEDETRRKAEEERLAKERKRIEEEEELRRKVREEQEKKRLEEEKRKQEEEEREKLAAIKRQEQASLTNAAAKQEAERLQREQDKKKRENSITMHVKKEQKIEDKRKQDREEKKMRKQFPELYQDEEDEDGDNQNQDDDDDDDEEEEESDKKNKKKKPVKKANKKTNKKTNNKKTSKKEKEKKKVEKKKKVQKKKRDEDNDGDGGDDNGDDNKEDVDNNVKKQKDNNNNEENASGKEENEEEQQQEEEEEEEEDDDNDDDENENSDGDDSDDSEKPPQQTLQQQLKQFPKIAATGQLFLKYTGKKRRKPQDRIVKVSFDSQGVAKQISWGSGSRHIDFSDILYIAHGHWTPVFISRKDQLDADLCFSVVGKTQILDVQASTKQLAELWVKGLRRLIGQTDADALKLAKQNMENGNLPGSNNPAKKEVDAVKDHKKRTKSLILLQQDLFVMTTTTVFRNLEEERIWEIDQSVRDRFNAKLLYEEALRQDIPWRQWNHWIREKIVTYLRENNRVAHQGSNVIVNPLFNGDFTSPITAPIIPSNYIAPQQQNIIMPQSIPIVPKQSNAQNNVPSGLKGAQPQDENCTLM